MTIFLYVKTHRKTGLKYLGKTTQKDPEKYTGSGKYWLAHIGKHGYDVETEILRECQSNEEVREWGLYYSKLWQVVESDRWANLKEETGDGWTSEQIRQYNLKRVADGTNPFLDPELARRNALKRVADGTHNFLGGELTRRNNLKRLADGTHHFLGGELARRNNLKRVANGTHPFLEVNKKQWTCPHCGKSGKHTGNFSRWHGEKCKSKLFTSNL